MAHMAGLRRKKGGGRVQTLRRAVEGTGRDGLLGRSQRSEELQDNLLLGLTHLFF